MSIEIKNIITETILHKKTARLPTMYRADPAVNERLLKYFGLNTLENDWEKLIEKIGADNFSNGETLNAFFNYFPEYIGPDFNALKDFNHFFIWGIKPVRIKIGDSYETVFHKDPPLYDFEHEDELKCYNFPKINWFDFKSYRIMSEAVAGEIDQFETITPEKIISEDKYFHSAFLMNSIFMTSIFLRGIDKMLMDLIINKNFAEKLLTIIGEFYLEFCKKNLGTIGSSVDMYGIWDDFASQDGLLLSPDLWRKYYKPWHKKIIEEAKKYKLIVCYHVCGNCSDVIGDLIDIGADILDPVQVSAKNMELSGLKKKFGNNICFHGGIDAQKLLTSSTPSEIKKEVKRVKKMFSNSGGIIIGPSHYITQDTPIKNILAIYT